MRFKFKQAVYVLSRMSTAVFLLAVLALASIAGTVILQNQPLADYQSAFGHFWTEVFILTHLNNLYAAPWYTFILLVMLASVVVCLFINGPHYYKLWRKPKRLPAINVLRAWPLHTVLSKAKAQVFAQQLQKSGFRSKFVSDQGQYYTRAPYSRAGYFLSHLGVVILAVGGLLTGFLGFRGTLHLPAQNALNAVWVQTSEGGYAKSLPFTIRNEGFALESYPDGTAKSFTTQLILLHNQAQVTKPLQVNKPVRFMGHSIYQSSYGDAGSQITLQTLNLTTLQQQTIQSAVHQQNSFGGATLSFEEARMHESRQLPSAKGSIAADIGPSVDVMLTWPDRRPTMLRLYLQHPDMLGVANHMTAEGTPIFAIVPLGLNPLEVSQWALFIAVKKHLAHHPEVTLQEALRAVSGPYLKNMPQAARIELLAKTLQALTITQSLALPFLPTLTHITPAYYTALSIAYDPGFWWFVIGSIMLIAGVCLMIYADHWRVWLVSYQGKVLVAGHAARRIDILQELWPKP